MIFCIWSFVFSAIHADEVMSCIKYEDLKLPGVANQRYFYIKDQNCVLNLDFDRMEYTVFLRITSMPLGGRALQKTNGLNRFEASLLRGSFSMDSDFVITMERYYNNKDMIIALNDGSDNTLSVQAFYAPRLSPVYWGEIDINFREKKSDKIKRHSGMLMKDGLSACKFDMKIKTDMFEPLSIDLRMHGLKKTIDVSENNRLNTTISYYPIYIIQNKPFNKLYIYVNPDFGIGSAKYKLCDGALRLLPVNNGIVFDEIKNGSRRSQSLFIYNE